jgi:NTE family protein
MFRPREPKAPMRLRVAAGCRLWNPFCNMMLAGRVAAMSGRGIVPTRPITAAVFSGGLGLASYHGGVVEAFQEARRDFDWVAGSSAGAVTAALIAGSPPGDVPRRLRSFWNLPGRNPAIIDTPWAHLQAWGDVARSRLFGSPGHFHPRWPSMSGFKSLYDLDAMRRRLAGLIDFKCLNEGDLRLSIVATDLRTGDPVIFDNRTCKISLDHILASCGFLPEFAPVRIDGRDYVDGGLSLNAPFEPVLDSPEAIDLFVIDLFARDGPLPGSLEAAAERKTDLMFGNQTFLRLQPHLALRALRRQSVYDEQPDRVTCLSYRSGTAEPGPEKSFNFSYDGLARRWQEGLLDARHALVLRQNQQQPLLVVRRSPDSAGKDHGFDKDAVTAPEALRSPAVR